MYKQHSDKHIAKNSNNAAMQQSTLLYLGAKVREVEKKFSESKHVDVSKEDAYSCLEVLSVCSEIYSPVQPALKSMRKLFQNVVYPMKLAAGKNTTSIKHTYSKVNKQITNISNGNNTNVNKVNVEQNSTDNDLRSREPYCVLYQQMERKNNLPKTAKIGDKDNANIKQTKHSKTIIGMVENSNTSSTKKGETDNTHEYIRGNFSMTREFVAEKNKYLIKKVCEQEQIIHSLNFELLELKKEIFVVKRQMGKSQLEAHEHQHKLKVAQGCNDNKFNDHIKGKFRPKLNGDSTSDYISASKCDDGKNADNITNAEWGERKKRRNRLIVENLSLQEELRMANLQIQLLERKIRMLQE